jgi:integrase
MAKGHIRQRGKNSWELKFDAGRDPATGLRKTQYVSFKGSKREAQTELAKLITAVSDDAYVEQTKTTVASWVRERIDIWEAKGDITARTSQRYRQLCENQIVPFIGATRLQKLTTTDVEAWHLTLGERGKRSGRGGVTARTILHAHRVLSAALRDAQRHGRVQRNVAQLQRPPRIEHKEAVILDEHGAERLLVELRGHSLYAPAVVALYTGMRLGEVLALRWCHVDLSDQLMRVCEALEETKAHGLRVKKPKKNSGRDIDLPDIVVDTLSDHRRQQLELRMQLGLGKLPDDALVFPNIEGDHQWPRAVSQGWGRIAKRLGIPDVTFHNLRHTHASQLIDAGLDVVTISKRLGHKDPSVTLKTYAHLFERANAKNKRKASKAINDALAPVSRS